MYDNILIESNQKIAELWEWANDNAELIKQLDDKAEIPWDHICFIFREETLKVYYDKEQKNHSIHHFKVYALKEVYDTKDDAYLFAFDYYEKGNKFSEPVFFPGTTKESRRILKQMIEADGIDVKVVNKVKLIAAFTLLHREYVVVDEPKERKGKGSGKKYERKTYELCPRRYIIKAVPKEKNGKRAYTEPETQVVCKGGVRHMKNGKLIPFKGCVKYKDKPARTTERTYKL